MTRLATTIALLACALLNFAQPAAAQSKYHEAPAFDDQVKAGKLPPVDQRLPEQPLVVPVVEKIGEYGGVWRRAFLGPADANNYVRVVYDGLFRFTPDGAEIEPKLALGAKSSDDYKVWTILLRKGARWSDGAPFTADDILFWYKDVIQNKDLTPSLPTWIRNTDGSAAKVEKLDDYTVRFTYDRPATLFLQEIANQDGPDLSYAMFLPAHYLKQFNPDYTPKDQLDHLAQAASFRSWTELFAQKATPTSNPERPTMAAWMPVSRVSDPVFTIRRNPYYIGVDKDGNQLPYIDEVRFTYFADQQALNLPGHRRQLRHAGAAHPDDQLSGAEGAGKIDRQVPRPHLADLRRIGCGGRVQHHLPSRSCDRQADGDEGFPYRVVLCDQSR